MKGLNALSPISGRIVNKIIGGGIRRDSRSRNIEEDEYKPTKWIGSFQKMKEKALELSKQAGMTKNFIFRDEGKLTRIYYRYE